MSLAEQVPITKPLPKATKPLPHVAELKFRMRERAKAMFREHIEFKLREKCAALVHRKSAEMRLNKLGDDE